MVLSRRRDLHALKGCICPLVLCVLQDERDDRRRILQRMGMVPDAVLDDHGNRPAQFPISILDNGRVLVERDPVIGIAEILRSRMCVDLLEADRTYEFGNLMTISHDGDRVSRPGPDGNYLRVANDCSDEYLQQLISDMGSETPHRVLRAQLFMQPGGYACSTPEIDQMVDIASAVPGVAGAQIAGAGLGGCIMVLVRHQSVPALRKALAQGYYHPRGLDPAAIPCVTVEGAGLAEF
jgi:galactokinase